MQPNEEIWRDVAEYEGLYEVSNLGRVRCFDHFDSLGRLQKGTIRVLQLDARGYYRVSLYKGNYMKLCSVHRLVAEAFIPNPENKPCVDHIDTNPRNNNVENLRWVTHRENYHNPISEVRHTAAQKRFYENKGKKISSSKTKHTVSEETRRKIGQKNKGRKLGPLQIKSAHAILTGRKGRPIVQLSLNGEYINRFPSLAEASRKLNISACGISQCISKRNLTAGGYIFRYANEYDRFSLTQNIL